MLRDDRLRAVPAPAGQAPGATRSAPGRVAGQPADCPARHGTQPARALRTAITAGWQRHHDLLANAGSLLASTGVTSALGFVYWALAARLLPQQEVGYGSAAISVMTLLGTIGMFGLGTVLIGELPRRRDKGGLISAALLTAGAGSLVLGLGFVIIAPMVSGRFAAIVGGPAQAALFTAGVVATAMSLVFDLATIGLLRGGLQLTRNIAFSAAKLVTLPAAALILHDGAGIGITASWTAGMALSLVPVAIRLKLSGEPVAPRPHWGVLRSLHRTALAHNWLNLAITVPMMLIPVLVTVVVSPSANAAFYAAWMLASFLYIVPVHLSTVLFAVAAGDQQALAGKLRASLRMSLAVGLPGMAVMALAAHPLLSLFGAGYARDATIPLWLLLLGYLPSLPKTFYIAVCRANGKVARAAVMLTAFAAVEIAGAVLGGLAGGLIGLSLALLAVGVIEGLATAPAVLRVALTPAAPASASPGRDGRGRASRLPDPDRAQQQLAGAAAA
ncbi:MAG: lipopolysaccharide biosynthesis protein [Streptosporangiaceae bacterium]